MRIKSKLIVVLLISILLFVIIGWVLYRDLQSRQTTIARTTTINTLSEIQYQRSLLRDEYLIFHQDRSLSNWNTKTELFKKLLLTADETFTATNERSLLVIINANFNKTKNLFGQIYEMDKLNQGGKTFLDNEAEQAIINELRSTANVLFSTIKQLDGLNDTKSITQYIQSRYLLAGSFISLILVVIIILLWVGKISGSLEESKVKDEALLDSIGDGVIATDQTGKVVLINPVAKRMLGWHSKEIVDRLLFDVVSIEDDKGNFIPNEKRPISLALAGITTATTTTTTTTGPTYNYIRKNKTKFPVAIKVTPVIIKDKIIGAVDVFRDISKEKEIDLAKSEFVSLASHQLRTPPTSIKWFLEMLLSGEVGELNKTQKDYFEEVYKNNQRMITLVNALLNVSRIELGVLAINPRPTEMTAFIKDVLEEFKTQIQEKKLVIKESYAPNLPLLEIDPKLLSIAVQDVISNAIKYTNEKGVVSLGVSLGQKGKLVGNKKLKTAGLVISVTDTGYGIPPNQYDKIFSKLFRADNVKQKVTDGTGLGLYLAKSIIEHAGGDIWFKSKLNKGTTFYLTIPLKGMKKREGSKQLITSSSGSTG